jgi:hypothetical protein
MEVVIHDSKVVQIERKEKIRFDTLSHNHHSEEPMTIQRCCRS